MTPPRRESETLRDILNKEMKVEYDSDTVVAVDDDQKDPTFG